MKGGGEGNKRQFMGRGKRQYKGSKCLRSAQEAIVRVVDDRGKARPLSSSSFLPSFLSSFLIYLPSPLKLIFFFFLTYCQSSFSLVFPSNCLVFLISFGFSLFSFLFSSFLIYFLPPLPLILFLSYLFIFLIFFLPWFPFSLSYPLFIPRFLAFSISLLFVHFSFIYRLLFLSFFSFLPYFTISLLSS